MLPRLRGLATPPMLVALLALAVSVTGVSYAATQLPKNSVGAKQLQKNAVSAKKVKDGSLQAVDFAPGQIPVGAPGAKGDPGSPGPKGDQGNPGPKGDQGNQGIQGIQGIQGNPGTQGNPGADGADAFAMVSGFALAPGFNQEFSLDGQLSGSAAATEGLSPNVVTTARNFGVKVDTAAPADTKTRVFSILINGIQTLFCSIPSGATSCTNAGSVAIPAGSRIGVFQLISAGGGANNPPSVVARWGFTVGT